MDLNPNFEGGLFDPFTYTSHFKELSNPKEGKLGLLEDLLKLARVNPSVEIKEPPACLKIVQDGVDYVPCTLGNFSLIIGKAKSRKTFFITAAVAAALGQDNVLDSIKGCLPENKRAVLYFDTEQATYHVQKAVQRAIKLSGSKESKNLHPYSLRKHTPSERLKLIEKAIYTTPNLGFVVIDGIRDLVTSINDEEQATKISSKLLKWSEELNIHIMTVLHQNKGDNNARGHIGSELQNKCESVVSITVDKKNEEISIIEPGDMRGIAFNTFAFEIDLEGLPIISKHWSINKTKSSKTSRLPEDLEEEFHREILNQAFKLKSNPVYNELVTSLQALLFENKIDIGTNKVKEYIKFYMDNNLIKKEGKENTKYCFYSLV